MRIAYVNTHYKNNHTGGGNVHMEQFVRNAVSLGHEIWSYPGNEFTNSHLIPTLRGKHIGSMRKMDVLYVRLEYKPTNKCEWAIQPKRTLYGFPIVVWEFNTIPEEGIIRGKPEKEVKHIIDYLRHCGKGCDLAICMSQYMGEYIQEKLEIERVLIVPNGSDPDLFQPDAEPVKRLEPFRDMVNIVWIGSAKIVYHDFEMLRQAAKIIWNHGNYGHIAFHIIGPGLVAEMAEMPPNVFYWGAETYDRITNWLAGMHIGLYLTKGELTKISTPLKLFDYLASGLAVVSTSQSFFIKDLFKEMGQPDLLIPPSDSQKLAQVLIELSSNQDRVKRLGKIGRQLVVDQYNWRNAVKNTMDEIESLLRDKNPKKYA